MRQRDTTNQIDVFTSPAHALVTVCISYGGNLEGTARYAFADMRHFLAHFGSMLPLTDCVFHIHSEAN